MRQSSAKLGNLNMYMRNIIRPLLKVNMFNAPALSCTHRPMQSMFVEISKIRNLNPIVLADGDSYWPGVAYLCGRKNIVTPDILVMQMSLKSLWWPWSKTGDSLGPGLFSRYEAKQKLLVRIPALCLALLDEQIGGNQNTQFGTFFLLPFETYSHITMPINMYIILIAYYWQIFTYYPWFTCWNINLLRVRLG